MGEKDITGKTLADYNDVFADILNVCLFGGEQRILAEDLSPAATRSQYKADGRIHEQERDVAKYVKDENVIVSLFGIEQQIRPEKFMPVRLIGYDGQSYRKQLLKKDTDRVYPVVSIVLYFGQKPWTYGQNLKSVTDIPKRFDAFVSDYQMKNLIEVAFMEPETVNLFRSDFKYVADYFVQMHRTKDYHPSAETIRHVDETLKLMRVLTGDSRFEESLPETGEERMVSMVDVFDKYEQRGLERGLLQGREEGEKQGRLLGEVSVYYTTLNYSPEKIAEKTHQPVDVIQQLINDLNGKK